MATFGVRVTPLGGADRVEGVGPGGELRVRIAAAPVDGAANTALLRFLATELGVARAAVAIESGVSGRRKRVRVDGVSAGALRSRWPGLTVV